MVHSLPHRRSRCLTAACAGAAILILLFCGDVQADVLNAGDIQKELGLREPPPLAPISNLEESAGLIFDLNLEDGIDDVLRKIVSGETFAGKQQWAKMVADFQDVLDANPETLLPVNRTTVWPAWRYCFIRLSNLGPKALDAYETLSGPAAEKKFRAAALLKDRAALVVVSRQYAACSAGRKALELLADLDLAAGNASSAAQLRLLALERMPKDAAVDPVDLAKLALALAQAGDQARLAGLCKRIDGAEDRPLVLGGSPTTLKGLAKSLAANPAPAVVRNSSSGRMIEKVIEPGPLLTVTPLDDNAPQRMSWSPNEPAVAGDRIFVQTETELTAVDARLGRTVWAAQLARNSYGYSMLRMPVIWKDAVLVASSLQESAGVQPAMVVGAGAGRPQMVLYAGGLVGRLTAFPVSSEKLDGPFLWSVSTRSPKDDAATPVLYFVNAPAVAGNVACLGARSAQNPGESCLIAYDCANGALFWKTKLPINPSRALGLFGSPMASDGMAFYLCTDMGTIVAADVADGSIKWTLSYASNMAQDGMAANRFPMNQANLALPSNPPLLVSGTLFVLPRDSNQLLAIDAATGTVKWAKDFGGGRGVGMYLLAADEEHVFAVFGNSAVCLDTRTGGDVWRVPLPEAPSGRSLVSKDIIMCPLQSQIVLLKTADGTAAGSIDWAQWCKTYESNVTPSGNLTVAHNRLVITGNSEMFIFADKNEIAEFDQHPLAGIRDFDSALERAILCHRTHKLPEALSAGRHAVRLAREASNPAQVKDCAALFTDVAESFARVCDWKNAADALGDATAAAGDGPESAILNVYLGITLNKTGDFAGAVALLQKTLSKNPRIELSSTAAGFGIETGLSARADVLIGSLIAEIAAAHPEAQGDVESAAKDLAKKDIESVLVCYPSSKAAADAHLARAEQAVKNGLPGAARGELLAVRRLRPGYRADVMRGLAEKIAQAEVLPEPPRLNDQAVLYMVDDRIPAPQMRRSAEPPGSRFGDHIYVSAGRSLQAFDARSEKLVWETSVGFIGVTLQERTNSVVQPGIEVAQVVPGYPAEASGMKAGDLIVSFDGYPVSVTEDVGRICAATPPDKKVKVGIRRPNEKGELTDMVLESTVARRQAGANDPMGARMFNDPATVSIHLIGREGKSLIAEMDDVLLWIDGETGKVTSRAVVELGQSQALRALRPAPVVGEGSIVVVTSSSSMVCTEMDGRRRWRVEFSDDRMTTELKIFRGKLIRFAAVLNEARRPAAYDIIGYDLWTGVEEWRQTVPCVANAGYEAVIAGDLLIVSNFKLLTALDPAGQVKWSVGTNDLPGQEGNPFFSCLTGGGDRIAALVRQSPFVLDARTGARLWFDPGQSDKEIDRAQLMFVNDQLLASYTRKTINECRLRYYDKSGKPLWDSLVQKGVRAQGFAGIDQSPPTQAEWRQYPLLFVGVSGNVVVIAQNLMQPDGRAIPPSVAILRLTDGELLRNVGLGSGDRYNIASSGKITGGKIVVFTIAGVMCVSTGN